MNKKIDYGKKIELEDGKRYVLPGNLRITCCDCGLVHDFLFYTLTKGNQETIYYEVRRNNRATAQTRRYARLRKGT